MSTPHRLQLLSLLQAVLFLWSFAMLCRAVSLMEPTAPVWLFSMIASIGGFFYTLHLTGKVENQHGSHRQPDPEVHGDSPQRAIAAEPGGGTTEPGPATTRATRRNRAVENTGIVLGEVEAYRCWRVVGDYLASMNGVVWLPSEPMSGVDVDVNNSNGVHAFKNLERAQDYAKDSGETAVGRVKLWGQIVEHEVGYRAEFARPATILDARSAEKKQRIRARYGLES